MSIKLAIAGRPMLSLADESITLGSDPTCSVAFPESTGALPKHAVIRKIAGRWLIEVRDAESVFVGNSEPKRLFWLNPGDVIRLTQDGPEITFQPSDDHPRIPAQPPQSSQVRVAAFQSSDDDLLPLPASSAHASDVILPPDSHPSIPVKKPVSSGSIPVPRPPLSGTIKTPKSPSSTTIKTTKPPSSGTIKSRPPSSTTIRTVNPTDGSKPASKLSRSSGDIPVPGAPLKRKSGHVQIPSDDDDVAKNVPVLQRMSSWDEDDPTQRKTLTEEQAEMRWIMMVVGRCLGAGLVVLVLWLIVSWGIKSMGPSGLDAIASPTDPAAPGPQNSMPVAPPSQSPGFGAESSQVKSNPDRTSEPPKKKAALAKSSSPPAEEPDAIEMEKSSAPETKNHDEDRKPKKSDRVTASGQSDRQPDSKKLSPKNKVVDGEADAESGSTTVRAVKDTIYAVTVEDSSTSQPIQLGTAWAASNRYLVTSATVVSAIEEHRQQGHVASVVQCSTGKSIRIKTTRLHDSYRKASELAEEAREERNASRVASERANQIRFDLGVLDVGRIERLSKKIPSCVDPLDDSKESDFVVVGLPFQPKDADAAKIDENSLKERRCKKPSAGTAPQNKDMELMINFGPDANGRNWSGCPVLNKDHKVIGVYSYLPPTGAIGNKPVKAESGVAWIGRLHEFAPDVE